MNWNMQTYAEMTFTVGSRKFIRHFDADWIWDYELWMAKHNNREVWSLHGYRY